MRDRGMLDKWDVPFPEYTKDPDRNPGDFDGLKIKDVKDIKSVLRSPTMGRRAGSAHIYVKKGNRWQLQDVLIAGDTHTDSRFGSDVALSGDTALVCAKGVIRRHTPDKTGAYLFMQEGDDWSLELKLAHGSCLDAAVNGNWAVAAMTGNSDTSYKNFSVVYKKSSGTWEKHQLLLSKSKNTSNYTGRLLFSSDEKTLIIATPDDHVNDDNYLTGAVRIYRLAGEKWELQQTLTQLGRERARASFGAAIALAGDYLAIGAPGKIGPSHNAPPGRVYLYERKEGEWRLSKQIDPVNVLDGDRFGETLAIDEDDLYIALSRKDTSRNRVFKYELP